ncbi:MAG: response regulator, partial [Synergistaceae bacterium]|nr:response regulator [Synergistaceae bacterium]
VSLDVTCERNCGDAWLSFSVSDTGVGIRREDIPNLFTEYMQFDTTKDLRVGGTGLGLSICKNLVGMMGGEIKVESEYGLGSKFTVRIPQKITEPAPIGRNTAADLRKFHLMKHQAARDFVRAPIPFAKVLIVDDVITNLDVAMVLLAPYKLTAHCVSGGKDAVEAVRREEPRYDIIFMDHMMPDVDGIEAVRIIREEIGTDYARNVPIIALTANAIVGNEDMFLTRGFNAFISKPIDVRKLDRMLRRWVLGEDGTTDRAVPDRTKTQSSPEWSIDGVDAEKGIASFDGEKNYLTVLDSYAKHTLPLLEGLADVSEKSLEEYALAVHGIKGASCGIMAEDAAQMAEELEKAAKRGDSKMVLKLNGKFIASVRKLVTDIQAVTSVRLQNDSKTVKDSPDLGLLGRLLEDCRSFDFGGMDVTLREIENFVYEKDEELVKWLRERIDNLDYGDVLKRLETVLS